MPNPFFNNAIDLIAFTKARAGDVEANFSAVEAGFDAVNVQLLLRSTTTGGTFTGTHDYTGATVTFATQLLTDNTTKAATTAWAKAYADSVLSTSGTNFAALAAAAAASAAAAAASAEQTRGVPDFFFHNFGVI